MTVMTRQHEWVEIKKTPIKVVKEGDNHHIIADPMRDAETVIGCDMCNMGFDEGVGIACPGYDIFDTNLIQ